MKILELLVELSGKGCGCVIVTGTDGKLMGTFSDGDLRRTLQARGSGALHVKVGDVMMGSCIRVNENAMAVDAMQAMEKGSRKVAFLPVVDDDQKLTGLVTLHLLVAAGL